MLSRNDSDFTVNANGHARLSQGKVGELLKVSQQSISLLTRSHKLEFSETAETLAEQGFDGHNLALIVEYYAFDSRQASQETIAQCRKIYRQAAAKSFQDFIDQMAGIEAPTHQSQTLAFDEQVRLEADLLQKMLGMSDLHCNLVSGVLLNFAGSRLPALKGAVNEAHALLAAATPSELLLTPTAIGERLGISARQVNLLLQDIGYQVKNLTKKSKDEPAYLPTEIGQPYAANTLATGRLYGAGADNTSYQHLKWKGQVVEILREQMIED